MSQALYISVTEDSATKAVQKLIKNVAPRTLGEIVWPPALELTQRHLTAYKNKQGFPSQGFGEQLATKTYGTSTDIGAKIVVHGQGARQLFEGGVIKPVNKKSLCFGITEESYGKTLPEMFGGAIPPRGSRSEGDKAKLKALRPLFAFAKSARTLPHTDLLPTHEDYRQVAFKALKLAIKGGFHA